MGVPSVIACDGNKHARMHKIFAPAFSEGVLKEQGPVFEKHSVYPLPVPISSTLVVYVANNLF